MGSEFVDKGDRPTGKEYLSASLEDVIDRANKSSNESEIQFVTALFSAKSLDNQRKTSNKMFYVAFLTTMIAALSLAQNYYSSIGGAAVDRELVKIRNEVSDQDKEIIKLQTKVAATASNLEFLRAQNEEYLGIIENLISIEIEHKKSIQPSATVAD
ncbi:MAG: hypothetical protein WD071_10855 [Pseudohongiella sp.]|uniref:hypothetical protein n=1 Tax=Pseudohongiella sp. TaxID=1979412 RepID=UPI0034A0828A